MTPPKIVVSVNPETGAVHRAVERLDLEVAPHEFLCVVGPSGCGKSTLLSAIAGVRAVLDVPFARDGRTWGALNADPRFGPLRDRLLDLVRTPVAATALA